MMTRIVAEANMSTQCKQRIEPRKLDRLTV